MSHRRLALVALGAASLLAAAVPTAHAALPVPRLVNAQVTEPDSAAAPLAINVALDRPNPYPFPISVGLGDYSHIVVRGSDPPRTYGTATAGVDYKPIAPFRLEWQPGQQMVTFPLALIGDELDEANENINLRISGPSPGIDIGDNDIDVVLRDNDPLGTTTPGAPSLVLLPNAWLSEPDAGCSDYVASVLLARPTPLGGSVLLVDGTSLYGSATAGSDYAAFAPLRLNFAPGSNSARFVLQVCGDTVAEADEEIDIRAVAPVGVQLVDNDLDVVLRNED
jgi:hypothetical protein